MSLSTTASRTLRLSLPRSSSSSSKLSLRTASSRSYSLSSPRLQSGGDGPGGLFRGGPAPPRLPADQQKIFEELQRRSTGAFSTARAPEAEQEEKEQQRSARRNMQAATPAETNGSSRPRPIVNQPGQQQQERDGGDALPDVNARVTAKGKGEELHPDIRRGARPEFEGERNPKTGEMGGPKNEPLRWGGEADWSFNGRVTDF